MIEAVSLQKAYGGRAILEDASLRVGAGERVALVGPNGAGKTTLLRILAGEEAPDDGVVRGRRGLTVGYLPQEIAVSSSLSLIGYVEDVADDLRAVEEELRRVQAALETGDDALLDRYGALQSRFEHLGGYRLRSRAERVLAGLGFSPGDHERPVDTFSGGWRMRAALARILLREPDLVLLDEPTNHLDLDTLEWFENHLHQSTSAFVVVSHDVAFLDRVVQTVLALEGGRVVRCEGNYTRYEADRARREQQARAAYDAYHRRRAEVERFAERFRAKATKARQVQSRLRLMEREEPPPPPPGRARGLSFSFPQPPRSGRTVAELEAVHAGYGGKAVYNGLDLRIDRGEKVALVGPNGAGKSTLLKLLAGVVTPWHGRVRVGHNVETAYFAQHHLDQFDPARTVLDEILGLPSVAGELQARSLLGAFLFSDDAVDKRVGVLSGGEKSRLALARMLASRANFLLLDEPTNHLDIDACEVLKRALERFQGTVCMITHDRDLINRIATRVAAVAGGRVESFPGNHDDYLRLRAPATAPATPTRAAGRPRNSRRDQRRAEARRRERLRRETAPLREEVSRLEAEIERLERELAEVEVELADPGLYAEPGRAAERARARAALAQRLERTTAAWEEAATAFESKQRELIADDPD